MQGRGLAWIDLLAVLEAGALESVSQACVFPTLTLLATCSVLGCPSILVMKHPRQSTDQADFGSEPQRFGATNIWLHCLGLGHHSGSQRWGGYSPHCNQEAERGRDRDPIFPSRPWYHILTSLHLATLPEVSITLQLYHGDQAVDTGAPGHIQGLWITRGL